MKILDTARTFGLIFQHFWEFSRELGYVHFISNWATANFLVVQVG
jgi:hypothetical protein